MQSHSDANRPAAEGRLTVDGGRGCVGRTREGDEERVALRVDLDPAVLHKRSSQCTAMLAQQLRIPPLVLV
jgi:hypothetical protein